MKRYTVTVNGKSYDVSVEENAAGGMPQIQPIPAAAPASPVAPIPAAPAAPAVKPAAPAAGTPVTAPMPGTILAIKVELGQTVAQDQPVCVLEAMKMENDIVSPVAGRVLEIRTAKGGAVNAGDAIMLIG